MNAKDVCWDIVVAASAGKLDANTVIQKLDDLRVAYETERNEAVAKERATGAEDKLRAVKAQRDYDASHLEAVRQEMSRDLDRALRSERSRSAAYRMQLEEQIEKLQEKINSLSKPAALSITVNVGRLLSDTVAKYKISWDCGKYVVDVYKLANEIQNGATIVYCGGRPVPEMQYHTASAIANMAAVYCNLSPYEDLFGITRRSTQEELRNAIKTALLRQYPDAQVIF